jgi:hypothetical protein
MNNNKNNERLHFAKFDANALQQFVPGLRLQATTDFAGKNLKSSSDNGMVQYQFAVANFA